MSHRIKTTTQITDKDLAILALKAASYTYVEQGKDVLLVTSGPMAKARINCKTGEVSGDTDYHNKGNDSLGALKQRYTEMKLRRQLQMNGGEVLSSTVKENGDIVLHCKAAFG